MFVILGFFANSISAVVICLYTFNISCASIYVYMLDSFRMLLLCMSEGLLYFLCLAVYGPFVCLTIYYFSLVVQPAFSIGAAGIQIGIFTTVEKVGVVVIMMSSSQWLDCAEAFFR